MVFAYSQVIRIAAAPDYAKIIRPFFGSFLPTYESFARLPPVRPDR